MWIKKENAGKERKRSRSGGVRRWVWTIEGREEFKKALEDLNMGDGEVKEIWKETKGKIKRILEAGSRAKKERMKRGWWNEEYREKKKG